MSDKEEIVQIITIFRHGKRNSFLNLDSNELSSTDLCPEDIPKTINKGRHFIKKYYPKNDFPFNSKDFKCLISESIRTIKTLIFRLIDYLPKQDYNSMTEKALKEFTLKNIPNAVYDPKIFKSFEYSDNIASKYCENKEEFQQVYDEVEKEISSKSDKVQQIYHKYLNHPFFKGKAFEFFKLSFIFDFLNFIAQEVQNNFNEEQKIVRKVLNDLDVNKRFMEICFTIKEINLCFSHQLICSYYDEMDKVRKNKEDKKKLVMYSGHDLYLHALINLLEITDKKKFRYSFDDEINFILFKKNNNEKLYFKVDYNDETIDLPISTLENKKECELDTVMEKIEKEFLIYSYDDIMDFCHLKNLEKLKC